MDIPKKRKVKDVPIFTDPKFFEEIYFKILSKSWKYKTIPHIYKTRDNALLSGLVLTGCRPSELRKIKLKQTRILDDRILFTNIKTLKKGYMRPKIICPKSESVLSKFTFLLEEWLNQIEDPENYIFPSGSMTGLSFKNSLSRYRIERIVKYKTGLFPAWFRGVHETYYGTVIFKGNAWKLKDYMGLRFVDSTAPYVTSAYEQDIEDRLF